MQAPFISLGSEQLSSALLQEVDVTQRLNDHWTCRIVLRDTPDRRPAVEDYAGKELKITTTELDGTETIVFHGLVRGMRLIYEITGAWGAELEAVSATWKMAQGTRLRYLRQQTAQAAAQAIVSGAGLQMGGAMPAGANLSYVQWDETDYSFFARLVDDTEAWFRPAVDGSGGVDVETAFQSGATVNWREGEYGLMEWTTQGLLQPVTASGANYDPQTMQSTVVGGTSSSVSWYGGAADKMVAAAQSASGSVESAWVDRHRAATLEDLTTRMQRESRRGIANTVRCTGISRNPKVRAGDTLAVTGLPGVDATYGVVEVRHVWSTQGYENHFVVTPAQRWSPPVRPARPQLDGVYPARVVDNHDPHNQGRVRVQYYWQESNQSTWVRLLTPHAGAGRGTLFLPELGDEVLVTFEEGDSERPYVVGSAWNGVHQPPATGFHSPGETNGSEFAQNNIKRIVTKSGHRITLVDTPGKETISLATPTSNRIMLTESHADTGGRPAIVLESAGDIIMAAPGGRIHTQSMHRSAEVGTTGSISKAAGTAGKAPAASPAKSSLAPSSGAAKSSSTAKAAKAAPAKFDCAGAWAALDNKAKQTCDSYGSDVRARNKKISSDYAQMYLQDKRLEWAGMAGFASKQVGCGMDACDDIEKKGLGAIGMPFPVNVAGGTAAYESAQMKAALGQGNRAVYEEIYPVHQFYEQNGLQKLKECGSARNPKVPPSVIKGFEKIDAGDSKTGSLLILQHEQHDVLQPQVFDNPNVATMMTANQEASKAGIPGAQETKLALSSRCNGQIEVLFTGSDPASYEQRWPFASKVGDTFDYFAKRPADSQLLDKGLQEIYENGK